MCEPLNLDSLSRGTGAQTQIPSKQKVKRQPLEGITIMINPGHGGLKRSGIDTGAVTRFEGKKITEMELNDKVAENVQRKLEKLGANVIYLDNTDIHTVQKMENKLRPDAFVSIHQNAAPKGAQSWNGEEMFAWQPEGIKVAELINNRFKEDPTIRNRGINRKRASELCVLKANSSIPAVLVECGFMSNKGDLQHLKNQDYQNMEAQFIVDGLRDFFRIKKHEKFEEEIKKETPIQQAFRRIIENNNTPWLKKIPNEDI